nr:hypothetical protein [Tanacetum cinerariifolium]
QHWYNAWQNGRIQVAQNAVQNPGVQNDGVRVLEMGIKSGATIAEDWVTFLGIAQPDQGEGMLLIFRLTCALLKRKKQGFYFKQKNLNSWLVQNDNHVTSVASSMVQSGRTLETSSAPNEETHAHQETVHRNLIDQVAQSGEI